MTIPAVVAIQAGDDLDQSVVNAAFADHRSSLNGNLDNTNFSSAAGDELAGTKVAVETNTIFLAQHSAAGAHTIASDGMKQWKFRFTSALTTSASFIDITMLPASGTTAKLSSQTDTYAHTVAGVEETHTQAVTMSSVALNALDTGTVAASTDYYLYLIHDSSGTESTDAGFIWSEETTASSTFWSNITDNIWTGGYTGYVSGPLAHVLTNADGDGISAYGCSNAVGDAPNAGTLQEKTWYEIVDMLTVDSDLAEDGYAHTTIGDDSITREDTAGLVIQWGLTAAVAADSDSALTFPLEFPTACFVVTCSAYETTTNQDSATPYVRVAPTTTGCTLHNPLGSGTEGIYWIAIGN